MAKRTLLEFLNGYDSGDQNSSGKKFCVEQITGSANRVSLTRASKYVSKFFEKLTNLISYTPARAYGAFLCAFGALSLVLHFVLDYVNVGDSISLTTIVISSALALIGLPFLASGKPLSIALQNNPVTDFVFFEFFCIRRMHRTESFKGASPIIGVIFGIAFAALSAAVPLWTLIYTYINIRMADTKNFSVCIVHSNK